MKDEEQETQSVNKHKSLKILIIIIVICILAITGLILSVGTNIDYDKLSNYSKTSQEILYAIEYSNISSLDSTNLKKLDNEILEYAKKDKKGKITQLLGNYHMGIGMMSDNTNTNNRIILNTIKSYLENAESEYQELLSKNNKTYENVDKNQKYIEIDNYKLSDLLDIFLQYYPEYNMKALHTFGSNSSLHTGYFSLSSSFSNKTDKEIKYIDLDIDICDTFKEKLQTKSYQIIGPIASNEIARYKFDKEYISEYNVAEYIKISNVKITYIDNSIISLKDNQIDKEAQSEMFH